MHRTRRGLLAAPFGLAAPALAQGAWQPDRPLRLIVPYTPAGVTDQLARFVAERLSRALGQPVPVENRPGANTQIGAQAVVSQPADGTTLFLASAASMVMNPLLYRRMPFDTARDFTILSVMLETPLVLVVNPSVPARTVPEFIDFARQNPTAVNYASVGIGNPLHLAGELFRTMAGVEMQHIPYPGSAPALTALVSGDVQAMFDVVLTSLPFIRDDRLRPLGVTTAQRLPVLPETPAIGETLPGYVATTWLGIAVRSGLPAAAEARLRAALDAILTEAAFRERFGALGLLVQAPRDRDAIAALVGAEKARWAGVIEARGITLD